MNEKEVAVILEYLSDIYPNFKFDKSNPKLAARMVKSWHSVLGDFEFEDGLRVTKKIVLSGGSFAPNAGQIANEIIKNRKPDRKSPEEAWNLAKNLYVDYRRPYYKKIYDGVPDEIKKTISLEGGVESVYYNDTSYDRTRFMKTYEAICSRQDERELKQIAGVGDLKQIGTEDIKQITDGIKKIGRK